MSHHKLLITVLLGLSVGALPSLAQDTANKPKLNVLEGPAKAQLKTVAQLDVPTGYRFLDAKAYQSILKAEGEPVSGRELGLVMPTNEHWSVVFEFDDIGYVKDDDKNKLDADKLLDSIKRGTAAANKERARNGNPPLEVVGWEQPPRYDETTHNLEWAVRATSEGKAILNYNTRLLGRKGVMEAVLIVEPDNLPETLPRFRSLLAGYSFQTGQNYAEYHSGDKVAKYGLAALVVGGAAVGAAKLGLFTWLALLLKKGGKLIIVGVVAVAAAVKRFFAKLFGKPEQGTRQ